MFAFCPTLIIKLQPASAAAGTCHDQRRGLWRQREGASERETVKRLGTQYQHHVPCCYGVRVCLCVCMCDVSPTPLSGLPPCTGTHLHLCVHICLRSGTYRIVCAVSVSSCISCCIILKKTIAIKHRLSNSSTFVFVRTANAYPLPLLCLKIDLFLNDLSAPQSSRLEDRRVYGTNCSPGLRGALSPPHSCTRGCTQPPSIPFRVQMVASACARQETPSVKQGIGLIDMQAALLLQSRGGSFAVERAGRQLAGATV